MGENTVFVCQLGFLFVQFDFVLIVLKKKKYNAPFR